MAALKEQGLKEEAAAESARDAAIEKARTAAEEAASVQLAVSPCSTAP